MRAELGELCQASCCSQVNWQLCGSHACKDSPLGKRKDAGLAAELSRHEGLVVTCGSGLQPTPCLHRARKSQRHGELKGRGHRCGILCWPWDGSPALSAGRAVASTVPWEVKLSQGGSHSGSLNIGSISGPNFCVPMNREGERISWDSGLEVCSPILYLSA